MKDRGLQKLKRKDLIEIIYQLQKDNEFLKTENDLLKAERQNKRIVSENAGSIAKAALDLNKVFEAAQAAADQYLFSIKDMCSEIEQKKALTDSVCESLLNNAKEQAATIVRTASKEAKPREKEE